MRVPYVVVMALAAMAGDGGVVWGSHPAQLFHAAGANLGCGKVDLRGVGRGW